MMLVVTLDFSLWPIRNYRSLVIVLKRFERYLAWLHQPFRSNSPELERRGARELKQEQHMMDAEEASAPFLKGWVPGCRA